MYALNHGHALAQGQLVSVPLATSTLLPQTLSIFFLNPDVTSQKITPRDDLVSWKWMLNKKDVTIVVATERGVHLNVREVANRLIRLWVPQFAVQDKAINMLLSENDLDELPILPSMAGGSFLH
ncbi:hypothetical protein [Collimonas sp. PA-H2]|uniref:defense against restriction DarA-related protein n=1 Tax=Collimonas sp. PA-H2 TaxID=1881062 RepID=UPI00117FA0D6|nr:hypothetical protein [Collimonas sp. PA-H2]